MLLQPVAVRGLKQLNINNYDERKQNEMDR